MTTLVTGATGRIGSRFVPRLLQRGDTVRVLVRDSRRLESLRDRGAEVVVATCVMQTCVSVQSTASARLFTWAHPFAASRPRRRFP